MSPPNRSERTADPELFIQDLGIAAAMDMEMDLVSNSIMARALRVWEKAEPKDETFEQWQLQAAEEVIAMWTIDHLGPRGAYHESIEALRAHSCLREFRQYMSEADSPGADATALAAEVNLLATQHSVDIMDRFVGGRGKLRTIGRASIGPAGNLLHPGLGSLLRFSQLLVR